MRFLSHAYRFGSNFVFLALVYYSLNFMEKYSQRAILAILVLVYAAMRAAELMVREATRKYEAGLDCGAEANMAKMLAADASWEAANACVQTHGGFGFAEEYDVERKFRETRLYQVAPISTNLILSYLAEHVLGMPRSY